MKKKWTATILCLAMAAILLAGCGGGGNTKPTPTGDGTKLTIGLMTNSMVEDYETNAYTKWLEEQTGYDLEFVYFAPSISDAKTQLSTRIAGGEKLPDILWHFNLGTDLYTIYGEDGYFIDLAPYFNDETKSAPFYARQDEFPEAEWEEMVRRMVDQDSGAIYGFPGVEYSEIDNMDYMMYINQDWLDKLGLKMPTNPDELYDVLVAFRDKDPNGNGLKDEIPLMGTADGMTSILDWLVNMFVYCDNTAWFNVDSHGQLYLPQTTDAYRQALIYMNKLTSEGLLPTMVHTVTSAEVKAIFCPQNGVSLCGVVCGHLTLIADDGAPTLYEYSAMPYWGNAVVKAQSDIRATFITEDCENPDAAWNLLMTMWSKDSSLRQRYGEYGVDWTTADEGGKSFLGYDAEIKLLNGDVYSRPGNQLWQSVDATMLLDAENEKVQMADESNEWTAYKMKLLGDCHDLFFKAAEENNPTDEICPRMMLTSAEKEETVNERANCQTYIGSCRAKFITGEMNPNSDAEWQRYLNQLTEMGADKWKAQAQKVYDTRYAS